jgi:hypothetical protein
MPKFNVDYVTKCGSRGVWHYEVEAYDAPEVEAQCRSEIKHIARELKRRSDRLLAELVVVELVETDVLRVRNA